MDKYIDSRFDRVERALASLIDSISKYTPSSTQASELAASDRELSNGLTQLQTHQNNYARIQKLRQETADLDAQIKNTISVLWTTRKEITATPTTTYPPSGPKYQFTYAELLNYARRISRTTLPPPGVTNGVDLTAPPPPTGPPISQNGDPGTTTPAGADGTTASASGAATPVATTGGADAPSSSSQPTGAIDASQTSTTATALPEHMLPAVNLLEGAVFHPWPAEERIRGGALAVNQQLREAGVDPRGHDPEEEEEARRRRAEAEEAERRRLLEHERERRAAEERDRAAARERARAREREEAGGAGGEGDAWRRGSVAAPAAGEAGAGGAGAGSGEKKQFQFMGDLDDDDDDD
ncbi:vitamin-D-receptor interacting mediator subunit 4-domain-containing protein [Phialemonium atrogriseum]|uniref:Mediator of RNA polymerase II transcription subunit 4 n=1 Tax=Phialemonium atrogriseum TaxID=1093897 RepID=A0AAJ0C0R5_9PEZI|nr:vitamin-D-receptor interacting mediator subunit 4-domain-containing protein [Phialemonium atrogriseum]KAK1768020.1 vitamin-D-receptor interacting mediator subunit 4-domain-containing protein [Phialemonium atrogriseum]